jgi:hypothetical protein
MSEEGEILKEGAKAVTEVAKTTSKAIDATRSAGGWLDRIFGDGIEHAVARRWSDRELVRRIEAAILDWERLVLLMDKVQQNLRVAGIAHTRIPPPKIILPLLEHATMEHEDDLHTMYANLLTAAINPSAEEIERKFVRARRVQRGGRAYAEENVRGVAVLGKALEAIEEGGSVFLGRNRVPRQ